MTHPIVFISYSHDSDAHRERVLNLSERLRRDGYETRLDRYVNGSPPEGWPRWMLNQIDEASHVLVVCTETYYWRFRGKEAPGVGKGVDWEGGAITQELYDSKSINTRFIPIVFEAANTAHIPEPLRPYNYYQPTGDDAYEQLLDAIEGTAGIEPAPVGERKPRTRQKSVPAAIAFGSAESKSISSATKAIMDEQLEGGQSLIPTEENRPQVYISYCLRDTRARERAIDLADRLRRDGIDTRIDVYYSNAMHGFFPPSPKKVGEDAWTRWQKERINRADFVIIMCGPSYTDSPIGSGVANDLQFMQEDLGHPGVEIGKFIPVGFRKHTTSKRDIPPFLQGCHYWYLGGKEKNSAIDAMVRYIKNASTKTTKPKPERLNTKTKESTSPSRYPANTSINNQQTLISMQAPVDFVIITPLEEERTAMLAHLGNPKRLPPSADDVRVYYPVSMPIKFTDGKTGAYNIVVTDLLGMGRVEAANAVNDAIKRWKPKYLMLVGIAGGMGKATVRIGDVLIADQVADYELQKITSTGAKIRWSVHRSSAALLAAARQLAPHDWTKYIQESRPDTAKPKHHIGPICTGDKVVANGLLDDYQEIWTKLIGVEMEAGGAASAAFQSPNTPGFFMVRGVSDLADPDKDQPHTESWRSYACDVAASYVEAFLKSGPVLPISGTEDPR